MSGGVLPDLRQSSDDVKKNMPLIIKNGIPGTGMAPFGKWVSDDEAKLIQFLDQIEKLPGGDERA